MINLTVDGQSCNLPESCPKCHNTGIILAYNFKTYALIATCGPTPDDNGGYTPGCFDTIATIPMPEKDYRSLLKVPVIREKFSYLLTFPRS